MRRFQRPGKRPADLSQVPETLDLRVDGFYDGWRLDRYLAKHLPWKSRTNLARRIANGEVTKNGQRVTNPGRRVREGDRITVDLPPPVEDLTVLDDIELETLWEDEFFVAINKPPNLLCHPVGSRRFTSVINLMHARYRDLDHPERDVVPTLAHRLDSETSGVLLITKDRSTRAAMTRLFYRGEVQKAYLTIGEGGLTPAALRCTIPIGPRPGYEVTFARGPDYSTRTGQPARTRFFVLERLPGFDLIRCELETGRQHQIRVHLEALGHPVLGDVYYGRRRTLLRGELPSFPPPAERETVDPTRLPVVADLPEAAHPAPHAVFRLRLVPDHTGYSPQPGDEVVRPRPVGPSRNPEVLIDRVALHSCELAFTHPRTTERVHIKAPLPYDMKRVLTELRNRRH